MRDAEVGRADEPVFDREAQTDDTATPPPQAIVRREYVFPRLVYVAPHRGEKYHIDGGCYGLRQARGISAREPCLLCVVPRMSNHPENRAQGG